jgi:hypothetical protein
MLRQLSCSGSRGLQQPSRPARKDMPHTCVFFTRCCRAARHDGAPYTSTNLVSDVVTRAGGVGRTAWVARRMQRLQGCSEHASAVVAAHVRPVTTHRLTCRLNSAPRAARTGPCAAPARRRSRMLTRGTEPFPNAHPWHRTHRRTEVTVDHVRARSVQRSLERSGGGARCASRCAASAPPKIVRTCGAAVRLPALVGGAQGVQLACGAGSRAGRASSRVSRVARVVHARCSPVSAWV